MAKKMKMKSAEKKSKKEDAFLKKINNKVNLVKMFFEKIISQL
jgi:hypothetical protein